MAKPIFLVGFPSNASPDDLVQASRSIEDLLGEDYYILVYREWALTQIKFEVLNAVNATEIELADLVEKVKNQLNSLIDENKNNQSQNEQL